MTIPKPITVKFTSERAVRFWAKIDHCTAGQGPQGTCWEWKSYRHQGFPYGVIKLDKAIWIASRIAYFLCYGKDPWPLHIGHHCDNPPCCRPDHLFATTPKGNSEDMVRKGRSTVGDRNGQRKHPERTARGERQHLAKLTVQDVIKIRELYATGHYPSRKLGRMYHMDKSSILDLVAGRTWKHIP